MHGFFATPVMGAWRAEIVPEFIDQHLTSGDPDAVAFVPLSPFRLNSAKWTQEEELKYSGQPPAGGGEVAVDDDEDDDPINPAGTGPQPSPPPPPPAPAPGSGAAQGNTSSGTNNTGDNQPPNPLPDW
jgi:hypothetical protein